MAAYRLKPTGFFWLFFSFFSGARVTLFQPSNILIVRY